VRVGRKSTSCKTGREKFGLWGRCQFRTQKGGVFEGGKDEELLEWRLEAKGRKEMRTKGIKVCREGTEK